MIYDMMKAFFLLFRPSFLFLRIIHKKLDNQLILFDYKDI